MYNAVIRISLDVNKTASQINIPMFKGDTKRTLVFSLTEGGKPFRLDDCIVAFTGKKADGNFLNNSCEVDTHKQIAVYKLDKDENNRQTTTCEGKVECQLIVKKQNIVDDETITEQIASACFTITVFNTIYNDEEILDSESTLGALNELYVPINRTIAGIKLNKNLSRADLFNNIFTIGSFKPTDKSYLGDLRLVGLTQTDRDPYLLTGISNDGVATWRKFILDKDIINLVSNTLKIAGINLSEDISVAQLQKAIKSYPFKVFTKEPTETDKGEVGQFGGLFTYNPISQSYSVKLYLCCRADTSNNEYKWSDVNNISVSESQIETAVSNYLKENPLPEISGADGKSAYQLALDNGFEGSEEEWLESLQGENGKDGQDGADGINGKDGVGVQTIAISEDGELEITLTDGTTLKLGNIKGADGKNGADGQDGYSPTISVSPTETGYMLTIDHNENFQENVFIENGKNGVSVTDSIVVSDDGNGNVSMTWNVYEDGNEVAY